MFELLLTEILKIPEDYQMTVKVSERTPYIWDKNSQKWIYDFAPNLRVKVTNEEILSLINLVMNFTWVYCRDNPGYLQKQTKGMAMGTNSAPPLANIALAVCEIFSYIGNNPTSTQFNWKFPNPNY